MIKCQEHCQYNKTKIQQKDQDSSLLSEIDLISPTPQHKPKRMYEETNGRVLGVCCFKFYPRSVNKNLISSYYMTDDWCLKTGVILLTRKSRHICVDPNLPWVKKIMKSLDEATS
ncbi:C-C motif chemokine 3-like [Thunnus albacares]|uniref:C-C motif chemokine 3-like n=1 Tax=Thunnus albacares TaxID=8236 RepID=UPI001CF6399C|nr:C-C motif chemokine 3-like [Thunnus albacares]